jgi:protein AATF/BFR2
MVSEEQLPFPTNSLKRKREASSADWIESSWDDLLVRFDEGFKNHRNEVIDKWYNKVTASSSIAVQKKFKVINQSIVTQIETSLMSEKLLNRARINRSNIAKIVEVLI